MCGRTSLAVTVADLEDRFGVAVDHEVPKRYNIAPREELLVVRDDDPERGTTLEWGLVPHWADDPAECRRPINARAESVAETTPFRDAYENRRCLVLADGFYEWRDERGSRRPYRFERTDGEPFAFAGLWEPRSGDRDGGTCTILTTDASPVMEPVHDRMPLLLEPDEEETWLTAGSDAVAAVSDPYPDDELEAFEMSPRVNDPRNDGPGVAEPAEHTQSGLDEFSA